jgi:hypothetical protein
MTTATEITRCPLCGGRLLLHCAESRTCDLFDCADFERCYSFGTRTGTRWARRARPVRPPSTPPRSAP